MPKNIEKKVFPGDDLAVIEEYNDGKGTYQQDGLVRSEEIGETSLNVDRRAIETTRLGNSTYPKLGP
jgi:exosome complex RNA-binding protein Csl4